MAFNLKAITSNPIGTALNPIGSAIKAVAPVTNPLTANKKTPFGNYSLVDLLNPSSSILREAYNAYTMKPQVNPAPDPTVLQSTADMEKQAQLDAQAQAQAEIQARPGVRNQTLLTRRSGRSLATAGVSY
jgi:hypothetical protein